jgi:hypothetical protein
MTVQKESGGIPGSWKKDGEERRKEGAERPGSHTL